MTQEQRINKGTIIIFILSIVLLLCLCVTAVLAYFAGNQSTNTTLIMGGPVRVTMIDNKNQDIFGQGNLVMNVFGDREELLPGIGIDMQAIARVSSSDVNPTYALLRAKLDVEVTGLAPHLAQEVEYQIRESMKESLTTRIDSSSPNARDGWVQFDDGHYYYCSSILGVDPKTNQTYIQLAEIRTSAIGEPITFINGTFQFPYKAYTNKYADIGLTFNLSFQAIQNKLVNDEGEEIPNTIFNVKQILDNVDWEKHNN